MGSELYRDLRWLPMPPADFKERCRNVQTSKAPGKTLINLAAHALEANQLARLAKIVSASRAAGAELAPLLPFRLGILSNATTDFLTAPLTASGLRFGLALEVITANYDQALQSALDPQAPIYTPACDAILLAIDARGLGLSLQSVGDLAEAERQVESAFAYIQGIRSAIHANSTAICLVQTLARRPETLFGNADRATPGTWIDLVQRLNAKFAQNLDGGDVLVDVAAMAETVGLANWHDPTQWNLAKMPFALEYIPYFADQVCRVIAAVRGKSRKVLALDLDNTVWSGVVGDDGLEGIVIGQGDPTGEAHYDLQAYALALRNRGVVLAVSSKNEDEVARLPFRHHPDMLLREEHIAVFQANWSDKATNLTSIAQELSLGVDSFAFVDDNPFERNFVRDNVPGISVPELPEDPALYVRTLAAAGYFEALTLSPEDKKRADFYQDNARRAKLQQNVGSLEDYLASLEMEIYFSPFDSISRSRLTQLINKSNQFNLTTRRYTEAEIASIEKDKDAFGIHVRLKDRFGDNGIISVLICRRVNSDWEIDTWLMSCRVLGRKVESAVLRELLRAARSNGMERLIGRYKPTERNEMVRDHYARLGFSEIETLADGESSWQMETSAEVDEAIPIIVHSTLTTEGAAI